MSRCRVLKQDICRLPSSANIDEFCVSDVWRPTRTPGASSGLSSLVFMAILSRPWSNFYYLAAAYRAAKIDFLYA